MKNDEGHMCFIKASEIFREFVGDKTCSMSDVMDRIANAVAEGSSKKRFHKKGLDNGFLLMDWHGEAKFLIALSLFPERFTNAEIRQGVIWFLFHAGHHIPEAARLIWFPLRSHYRDKHRERKEERKRKGKRA